MTTELTSPVHDERALHQRRPTIRRPLLRWVTMLFAVLAGLGTVLGLAQPANAAVPGSLNPALATTYAVPGTNCTVTTSMWLNSYHYPGAGAYTRCSTAHQVYIAVEADWAYTSGGSWYRWGQSGYAYAGSGTVSSTVYQTWTVLGGLRQWRGVSYVYVDGVYRGSFASRSGNWTAGT
jgi:hypothetical protein